MTYSLIVVHHEIQPNKLYEELKGSKNRYYCDSVNFVQSFQFARVKTVRCGLQFKYFFTSSPITTYIMGTNKLNIIDIFINVLIMI